jgi:hypothetical protein
MGEYTMAKLAALVYDGCRLTELSEFIGVFNNPQHDFSIIDISQNPKGKITTEDGFVLEIAETLETKADQIYDCIAITGGDVKSVIHNSVTDEFIRRHDSQDKVIGLEMASRIPPFVAIKRDPPGEKNYLSFFSEILYDTPSREKTCA